jgi:Protein of unknown function (DUF3025)
VSSPHAQWDIAALCASPLFTPLLAALAALDGATFPTLAQLNALLTQRATPLLNRRGDALCFVPQALGKQEFEQQYEPRCYLRGELQTRADNLHDLFNALVWLTFPKAKAALNARHYTLLDAARQAASSKPRGAARDTATLLDESGVIVAYSDEHLAQCLREFQWHELFWQRREQVQQQMGFYIFGHGLYEKAMHPYVGMTGQGRLLKVTAEFFSWDKAAQIGYLDERLTQEIEQGCQHTHELNPVPLLGVPGWFSANRAENFYENTNYFRAGRGGR